MDVIIAGIYHDWLDAKFKAQAFLGALAVLIFAVIVLAGMLMEIWLALQKLFRRKPPIVKPEPEHKE